MTTSAASAGGMKDCGACGAFIQPGWGRCKICGHIPMREGSPARGAMPPPAPRLGHTRDPNRVKIATIAAAVTVALVGMAGMWTGTQNNSAGAETPVEERVPDADLVRDGGPGQSD